MPTASTVRRITPATQRNFGRIYDVFPVPDLTEIQTRSYERFLQPDIPAERARGRRARRGVPRNLPDRELRQDAEARIHQVRPGQAALRPRRVPPAPPHLRPALPRLAPPQQGRDRVEEEVYLGDMPIMIGGGEFIINGAERVVVSQLHRSPGVDFVVEIEAGDRKLHSCRIIPERGSWIEINVTKKDTLGVRIDQSGKFSAMTLLRAMAPKYSTDAAILAGLLRDRGHRHRRPQGRPRSSKAGSPAATSSTPRPARSSSKRHDRSRRSSTQILADARSRKSPSSTKTKDHADPPVAQGRPDHRPREAPCSGSTSGSGPATRRSWRRPRSCSARSSRTPTATASARSAGSASTASSTRTIPEDEMTLGRSTTSTRSGTSSTSARARGTSTTSTTSATAGCGPSTNWPPTSSARGSSSSAAPSRSA